VTLFCPIVFFSGWGAEEPGQTGKPGYSPVLRKVDVPIISSTEYKKSMQVKKIPFLKLT